MKKSLVVALLFVFAVATVATAHKGEVHSYMGTVTKINTDGSFVLKTTAGKIVTVLTSKSTTYTHADNHAARRSELAAGRRVVVKIDKDGKTATNVKMTASKKSSAK